MDNKRYRVSYELAYPFVIIDERQSYDSLLAWSMIDMLEQAGEDVNYIEAIDSLPLKKVPYMNTYFYSASSPIMSDNAISCKATISKSPTIMRYEKYVSQKSMETLLGMDGSHRAAVLDQGGTPYKQFMVKMNILHVKRISYIADVTDYEMFVILAENIKYIGKKKALGYGKVADISICRTDELISRIAPIDAGYGYQFPVFEATIKPPYWSKERYICGTIEI